MINTIDPDSIIFFELMNLWKMLIKDNFSETSEQNLQHPSLVKAAQFTISNP
jgi:hypothetical protein